MVTNWQSMPAGPLSRSVCRGVALIEMLLLTVPLCLLSIILASRIAAISSAKQRSLWMAMRDAQRATQRPCNGTSITIKSLRLARPSTQGQVYQDAFQRGSTSATEIMNQGADLLTSGRLTVQSTEGVPQFFFRKSTITPCPGCTVTAVSSAITMTCNEPGPDQPHSRDAYEALVFSRAYDTALELQ